MVVVPDGRSGSLIEAAVSREEGSEHASAGSADDVDFPEDCEEVGALAPVGHDFAEDVEGGHFVSPASNFSQGFHALVADVDDGVGLVEPFEFEDVWLFGSGELENCARFDGLVEPPIKEVEEESAVVIEPDLEFLTFWVSEDEFL